LTTGLKTSFEDSDGGEGLIEGLGLGDGVGTELEAFGVGEAKVGEGVATMVGVRDGFQIRGKRAAIRTVATITKPTVN
jgi:hypothetical protein